VIQSPSTKKNALLGAKKGDQPMRQYSIKIFKGLVDSFVYNPEKKKHEITTHVFHGLQRNVWWYITDKGKQLLS
jgi:hypothetical protein